MCLLQRLQDVADVIREKKVDVLLYIDRFDLYRVDGSDEQVALLPASQQK